MLEELLSKNGDWIKVALDKVQLLTCVEPSEFMCGDPISWHSEDTCIWEVLSLKHTNSCIFISCLRKILYLLIYLITELSSSWEGANCAAIQDLPILFWNPKVHYHVHKSPPLVPILSQIDPVHTTPSCLSKIYFNIVHILVFLVVSFLLAFPPISYKLSSSPPFLLHALPSHPPWLDHSKYTWQRV
jgi:hypothetical protein